MNSKSFLLILVVFVVVMAEAAPMYVLQAQFSMGGIRGAIQFLQRNQTQMLEIKVQFDQFSGTADFGIYSNPMIYNGNAQDSCNSDIVGGMIPNGNLTAEHEPMTYKMSVNNGKLKAYGKDGIYGRSVVIRNSTHLLACATILQFDKEVMYATAKFKSLVGGEIRFIQNKNEDNSDVLISGEVYFTDLRTMASANHGWYISSSSSTELSDCSKLTSIFKTGTPGSGTCSIHEPQACDMGDLSGKHDNISVGIANNQTTRRPIRYIDLNLALSKIIGHALVIRDAKGSPIACTNIMKSGPISVSAAFDASKHDGVAGSVSFKQDSPYHPTIINYALTGLKSNANGHHVHQYPIPSPEPASPCAGSVVGGHLNPYGIVKTSSYPASGSNATMDKYEAGDISGKFGTLVGKDNFNARFVDVQMDLFGRYSILGRGLVIHRNDAGGSRWVCSNVSPTATSKQLSATANFAVSSDLVGTVVLTQFMLPDGILTDTAITVHLGYNDTSRKTMNHNWHVHVEPVGADGKLAMPQRCQSVGPHYNPFKVSTAGEYSQQCSPQTPYRCELGDLNGKQTRYDIGGGKKYFLDVNAPLFGVTSVIGRSITFHAENAGAPRLACADIVPDSIAAASLIDLSFPEAVPFNKTDVISVVAKALSIAEWQVRYVKNKGVAKPCRKASFYVLANRQPPNAASYKTTIENMIKAKTLGKYIPCPGKPTGNSWKVAPSSFTVIIMSVVLFMFSRS